MPYLHLDLPVAVAPADRAEIAGRLARTYADLMETNPERVTVAFRELGENGVLRLRPDGALETVVMVNCDIRRGRAAEQRERLGDAVAGVLEDALDWPRERTLLEFTQHSGDEMWRSTGLGTDWTPEEAAARR
jgi:phenylpyruvate tautomerase PptA (4-oxalocrotonate tautomerase family)